MELEESFLPHFRHDLCNRLLCEADLHWQPPAGVHVHAHKGMCSHTVAYAQSEIQHDVLDPLPLFSNLDWLDSAQGLPSLKGHLCWKKKMGWQKRDRSERSQWGGWIGEVNEKRSPVSLVAVKSLCLEKLKTLSLFLLIILLLLGAPCAILSLVYLCGAKVGLQLEK